MVSCSFIQWIAPNLQWSIGKLIVHIIPLELICIVTRSCCQLCPCITSVWFYVKKSGRFLQFSFILDSLFTQAWLVKYVFPLSVRWLMVFLIGPIWQKMAAQKGRFFNYVLSHKDDLTSHSYDIETITISYGGLTNSSALYGCCCYFLPVTYKLVCMI